MVMFARALVGLPTRLWLSSLGGASAGGTHGVAIRRCMSRGCPPNTPHLMHAPWLLPAIQTTPN